VDLMGSENCKQTSSKVRVPGYQCLQQVSEGGIVFWEDIATFLARGNRVRHFVHILSIEGDNRASKWNSVNVIVSLIFVFVASLYQRVGTSLNVTKRLISHPEEFAEKIMAIERGEGHLFAAFLKGCNDEISLR